ncbi:MAG TPA: hypothetical protein VI524_04525 [Anaerolineales bacterium]|nr:hypothetical protein [Anaerolineales bacterium]
MLSNTSRFLTYLIALLYAILGLLLFFLSEQFAPVFAWKVTPFMTATMGGWCLGNAWSAFFTARRWDWKLVYPALIYLWAFGISELAVLAAFRDKLLLQHPIAWLYLAAIGLNALAAVAGIYEWLRFRPGRETFGPPARRFHYFLLSAFVLIVASLAFYGLYARIGDVGTNGGVFPEIMSLFTLRAFAAFYLSLSVSAAVLLRERNLAPMLHYGFSSYMLVLAITAAIFLYFDLFDFSTHPGQYIYVGAYFLVGIPLTITIFMERASLRQT